MYILTHSAYIQSHAMDSECGPGFRRCAQSQDVGVSNYKGTEEAREKLSLHTQVSKSKAD